MSIKPLSIDADSFVKMLEFLEASFGSAGDSMIFQMGRAAGISEGLKVLNEVPEGEHTKRELMENALARVTATGLAEVHLEAFDLEAGDVKVRYHDSVFKPLCLRVDLPQCYWMRGFLTGIVSEVAGVTLAFRESECYASGDADCSISLKRQA